MTVLQAIILGVVQGLTEFLPISSSAHLVLFPFYMGWDVSAEHNITYDVIVHFGTLFAVLTFFSADIKALFKAFIESIRERRIGPDPYRRLAWFIIAGTIPTGIVFLLIDEWVTQTLKSPNVPVSIFLLVTGTLLIASERIGQRRKAGKELRLFDVLFIGFAQGLAIFPGISRSGSTIAAGLFRGLSREEAARFSFLLAIPVILAASLTEIGDAVSEGIHINEAVVLVAGFFAAAVSGYFAIKYFIDYLKKHSLYVFALYCYALGTVTLILTALK